MSLPDAVRDRETQQDTISQQEVATITTCLYKLKPWWGETASRACQVWKRDPCYRRLGNLFSQATMKVLQSIANYRSLLFCCGGFLRAKFLLNSFLLYRTQVVSTKVKTIIQCSLQLKDNMGFPTTLGVAKKMWQPSLWVEWSEPVLSARRLSTQYGEPEEVVKLSKSERLSES